MSPLKPVEVDPRVSCPIVLGNYRRATGFFFEVDETHLITARHNVAPTSGSQLETGDFEMRFEMPNTHGKIDIYLRSDDAFDVETVRSSDIPYATIDLRLDVIAIPLPFDPTNYGYTVFGPDDIDDTHPKAQKFDTIGFSGVSDTMFDEYDADAYAEQISGPYKLSTDGPVSPEKLQIENIENVTVTYVDVEAGLNGDYAGLSGSPVLGDGLAGIHTLEFAAETKDPETGEDTDSMLTSHWRTNSFVHLLEQY